MNYDKIAEMVHDLVKTPKSIPSLERWLPRTELEAIEFTIIQRVFSKYEVSGDVPTVGVMPQAMWG